MFLDRISHALPTFALCNSIIFDKTFSRFSPNFRNSFPVAKLPSSGTKSILPVRFFVKLIFFTIASEVMPASKNNSTFSSEICSPEILFSIFSISFEFSISIKASSDFSLCSSFVRLSILMLSGLETLFTNGVKASSDLKHTPSQSVFPEIILIFSSSRIRNSVPFLLLPSQMPSSKTSLKTCSFTKASPVPSSFCSVIVTTCKSKSSD